MAEIPSLRRIAIVLYILPTRRIRQPIPNVPPRTPLRFVELALDGVHGIHGPSHNVSQRKGGVVSGTHFPTGGFDGSDGRRRRPGYDNVQRCVGREGFFACAEQLDAVFRAGDASRLVQFPDRDRSSRVDSLLGDPRAQFGEIDRLQVDGEGTVESAFAMPDFGSGLSAVEGSAEFVIEGDCA